MSVLAAGVLLWWEEDDYIPYESETDFPAFEASVSRKVKANYESQGLRY